MRETWHPSVNEGFIPAKHIREGSLIAIDHPEFRHKAWRVHDVRYRGDGRTSVIVRPDGPEFDFAQHNVPLGFQAHAFVYVLPEHYAVCVRCGQVPPCAEVWTERVSQAHVKHQERFELEGVCPACREPVTDRQRSHRFELNVHVPLGPPVTFHMRKKCWPSAVAYDRTVAKSLGRDPLLSCDGLLVRHLDHTTECTNITCPGADKAHGNAARCYALTAKCNRPECWAAQPKEITA